MAAEPALPAWQDDADLMSFGFRMPIMVFDRPEKECKSVYVFDVNPLVVLAAPRASGDAEEKKQETSGLRLGGDTLSRIVTLTTVVDREDIEEVLPSVVDPKGVAIPYVVYRFPLPYS